MKRPDSKSRVAVLSGGIGSERQISIESGRCVAEALDQAGFDVVRADVAPDNLEILDDPEIDVFFPVLHGQFGEDGRIQRILESKSLLYTGSGPRASELAFDKMISKKIFTDAGLATPGAIEFSPGLDLNRLEGQLRDFPDRYVVKPVREGSSIGVTIVSEAREAVRLAQNTFSEFGSSMIEEFVSGREITVSLLCGRALPVIEIRTACNFYDYDAKYLDDRTEYLFDTIADTSVVAGISRAAINCFDVLECRHFARVDFILGDDGISRVLEVNTIPGFTSHSLLPKAAARAGMSMSDLCARIVKAARSFVGHEA